MNTSPPAALQLRVLSYFLFSRALFCCVCVCVCPDIVRLSDAKEEEEGREGPSRLLLEQDMWRRNDNNRFPWNKKIWQENK